MKTRYIIALAAGALALVGCQREDLTDGFGPGDGQIRYSVTVASSAKGALINTTGEDDVLPGDNKFTVSAYKKGSATPLFSGEASKDGDYWLMDPTQYWPLSTKLTFYAYTNKGDNDVAQTATSQTLTYTVAVDAASHLDLMLGFYSGNGGNKGIAKIRFDHPLTAVRFKKGEMTGVTGIKSITINGLASGGTVTMDKEGVIGDWTVSDTEYETVVTLSPSGEATTLVVDEDSKLIGMDATGNYNGAFLLVPQVLADHNALVTVVLATASEDITVSADITSGKWEAGKTNTYTLGYGSANNYTLTITPWDEDAAGDIELDDKDYLYEFKVTGNNMVFSNAITPKTKTFTIESYRHENGDDVIVNREPVAFSAEYSTDGGETWLPFDAERKAGSTGISGLSASGNEGATKETFVKLQAAARPSGTAYEEFIKRWEGESMQGTESTPVDLSRMEIGGEGDGTLAQNTSNCYIVKHPGYYKIPCVYGNSIQNGTATNAGYYTSVSGAQVLSTFLNAKGSTISNAWVIDDVIPSNPKAAMIWCDYKAPSGNTLVSDVSLVNGGAGQSYIKFKTLSADELAPGNALLVLYNDTNSDNVYNDGAALWSWHIWITDADLSVSNVGVYDSNARFMSRNLGWSEGMKGVRYNAMDDVLIRLVQENSSNKQIITVSRPEVLVSSTIGASNLYYQQGRKDPFLGGRTMYGPNGSEVTANYDTSAPYYFEYISVPSPDNAQGVITQSIKRPFTFASNTLYDRYYYNLWSLNASSGGEQGFANVKTVYDPCPYGYKMPNMKAFSGFVYDAGGVIETTDIKATSFKNSDGEYDDNLVFPWSGSRVGDRTAELKIDASRICVCDYCTDSDITAPNNHRYCIYIGKSEVNRQNKADRGHALCVRPILEQ